LANGSDEKAFYTGKLAACRYFFNYQLPKVREQLVLISGLDTTALDITPEQFIGN